MGRPAMITTAPRNVPAYKGFSGGLLQMERPQSYAFDTFYRPKAGASALRRQGASE
jgi:hypothetical protein